MSSISYFVPRDLLIIMSGGTVRVCSPLEVRPIYLSAFVVVSQFRPQRLFDHSPSCTNGVRTMNLSELKENINISSAQFALSNFPTIDNNFNCSSLNEILINFKNKRDSWIESKYLFKSNDETQIFYGLTISTDLTKLKRNSNPGEQQDCITNFILGKVLKLAINHNLTNSEEIVWQKFNHCLIEILLNGLTMNGKISLNI